MRRQSMKNTIPPPIVTAVFLGVIYFTRGWFSYPALLFSHIISGIVLLIALVIMFTAVRQFKAASTTINPLKPEEASSLVTSGIFNYSRNPMYLGLALILIAGSLFLDTWSGVLFVPLFVLFMNQFQISPEETAMQNLFGKEFDAYRNRVRRWI